MTMQTPRGTITSTMGISTATVGATSAGSGLYGLSDELFNYLPILLLGGTGGDKPPVDSKGIVLAHFHCWFDSIYEHKKMIPFGSM